jgi:hypothetical protein
MKWVSLIGNIGSGLPKWQKTGKLQGNSAFLVNRHVFRIRELGWN